MDWTTTEHTDVAVPVTAEGPGSEACFGQPQHLRTRRPGPCRRPLAGRKIRAAPRTRWRFLTDIRCSTSALSVDGVSSLLATRSRRVRTIEWHLRKVFTMLEITSRKRIKDVLR